MLSPNLVKHLSIDELLQRGTLSKEMIPIIEAFVKGALNIGVCGSTGSGKTTLLNALAEFIPANESIITIEDLPELNLDHSNVKRLFSRPSDGKGEVTTAQLIKAAHRMNPHRIFFDEVRDAAINEFLFAINTRKQGSMFSMIAGNPEELLDRVVLLSEKPSESILKLFGQTINIVFQMRSLPNGRRRLTQVAQIGGYQSGKVVIENLFEYDYKTDQWIRTTIPFRYEKLLKERGIEIPPMLTTPAGGRHVG